MVILRACSSIYCTKIIVSQAHISRSRRIGDVARAAFSVAYSLAGLSLGLFMNMAYSILSLIMVKLSACIQTVELEDNTLCTACPVQ